eukprot:Hpha_TRINITY_DN16101_c3_g1::TRINITY_DN16101_c3_g1_i1::g.8920::m.8920/K12349/ASAH2; neutral ceramidase
MRATLLGLLGLAALGAEGYKVGVGKADATSSLTQTAMMGYANPSQLTAGLHTRLWARAFVVQDGDFKVAFVSLDSGMPSVALRQEVDKRLLQRFPDQRYTRRNVMISGTHSHSGPGGYFEYFLFEITSLGFVNQTMEAFTNAIVDSIAIADAALVDGSVKLEKTKLGDDSNINRSPSSYLMNPKEERDRYPDGNTDKDMVQLRFDSTDGKFLGVFNWFAIHGTALNFTNHLVSGDSRGMASQMVEQKYQTVGALPGQEDFVAAFAATNLGDVSPNTAGSICHSGPDEGKACALEQSTCPTKTLTGVKPRVGPCYNLGPGKDMYESALIMAQKQFDASNGMITGQQATALSGPVGAVHQYINMSGYQVKSTGGRTCAAAMGYSFAAGTTDGPGDFDFYQHERNGTKFWDTVTKDILDPLISFEWGHRKPTAADYACHAPKPVLLFTGMYHFPWHWHPDTVELQLIRIGDLFIAGVPGEFTTMSGRRLRERVAAKAKSMGVQNPQIVIAGLSNQYTHYITTPEEYEAQRYEAASTIFGKETLSAYLELFEGLTENMVQGQQPAPGTPQPTPPYYKAGHVWPPKLSPDELPKDVKFGQAINQTNSDYTVKDKPMVSYSFYGANLRHDPLKGKSFFTVEKKGANNTWVPVANDGSFSTRMHWESRKTVEGTLMEVKHEDVDEHNPNHPMRHVWGGINEWYGSTTGKKIDFAAVQKCVNEGKRIDIKRIFPSEHACTLWQVTTPWTDDHPVKKLVKDVSFPYTKTYSTITLSWEPAIDSAAAGEYRFNFGAPYLGFDLTMHQFSSVSNSFTLH